MFYRLPATYLIDTKLNSNSLDFGCTITQIPVEYDGIPLQEPHVNILLSKMPMHCWIQLAGALSQVSMLLLKK